MSNHFTSFLVKVASRCNLNCTYCYMYQHADQSWKDKPLVLSELHQTLLASRLKEYVQERGLRKILVIYHGGEPLIFGVDRLIRLSQMIRNAFDSAECEVDFGIQTNGVLLKESILEALEKQKISVSLSIDGPKEIHDQHRLDHKGKASFEKVYNGLLLLKKFPKVFTGCIAVINPNFEPERLFDFFNKNGVHSFNILLPDASHLAPPKWRGSNPNVYKDWLIQAFDCWMDRYSHIECKFFESILMSILGQSGQTDALGLGDVSLLNIETDGTYHDLDVLKITEENYSYLGMGLETHPIRAAENSKKIQFHRHLLTKEGLSERCLSCKHVDICGGGSVPHRFNQEGYKNPTVYCDEMYALLDHAMERFAHLLKQEKKSQPVEAMDNFNKEEMERFCDSSRSGALIQQLKSHLARKNSVKLQTCLKWALKIFPEKQAAIEEIAALSFDQLREALLYPTVFAWLRAFYGEVKGSFVTNTDGDILRADPQYFDFFLKIVKEKSDPNEFVIQAKDPWYRTVGKTIVLEHPEEAFLLGLENLYRSLEIVKDYHPDLYKEMLLVSPHIQVIKDASAHPEKDVSFSDETLPGALFIGVWKGGALLCPHMLAASLIHEHLHQKLYLLQQRFELLPPQDTLIFSPWPNVYRPPVGALHAVYVFTHVAFFWNTMLKQGKSIHTAECELEVNLKRLDQCINEINEKVAFTKTGQLFFDALLTEYRRLKEQCVLQNV